MNSRSIIISMYKNFLFWLSRKIDYPLIAPDTLQLNYLYRCNLRCRMCSMEEMMKTKGVENELSLDILYSLIKQGRMLGIKDVLIIGGEPFIRDDLGQIIEYAHQQEMKTIIATNGTLLIGDKLEMIIRTNPDHLVISMDSANSLSMDMIRGVNVYEKIIANIKEFNLAKEKNAKCQTCISFCVTIMDQNVEELIEIVNLGRDCKCVSVGFQPVISNNCNQILVDELNKKEIFIPKERWSIMEGSIDKLIEFKKISVPNFDFIPNSIRHLNLIKKYFKGELKGNEQQCYAGYNRLQVTQDSKVYFCAEEGKDSDVSFGDVRIDSLESIWFSKRAKLFRKKIKKCNNLCMQRCSYRDAFVEMKEFFQKKYFF